MKTRLASRAMFILVLCLLGGTVSGSHDRNAPDGSSPAAAQDINYLNQRLSTLEQRLFTIESTVNQLRSQAMIAQAPSPSTGGLSISREEAALLRTEIGLLQRQVVEVQCGLLKLDQRTLPAASRAQLTPAEAAEPCRRLANSPVRITGK
jgi:hypothetical protein